MMKTNTMIQALAEQPPVSQGMCYSGIVVTSLVVLFLAFDGIAKILRLAPVMEAS
jgi:hypothetical protein